MLRFRILLAAFAASCASISVHAQICTPFLDVPASDPFCADIQWMLNRGVTFGCTANQYCPANAVRRDQMAAFMFRLSHDVVFQEGGNAFGNPAVLGTTDDNALDVRVNDARVMRYEPRAISPNVIGGSAANGVSADVRGATIGGGGAASGTEPFIVTLTPNRVTDNYGTVGGGLANLAGDDQSTALTASSATVGGGFFNKAVADRSTVAGGSDNVASSQFSTVSGGFGNTASGNSSIVAGGVSNNASGFLSFAAGHHANANGTGCFVWGDASTTNDVRCDAPNRFVARSLGGVYFFSFGTNQATYNGVFLAPGDTAWTVASDRRLKENLHAVDTRDVLDKLLAMPISTWNLKSQDPSIRHIGAMSQDFRAAFGLGETELGINTIDADGVALAAIQGLNAKLEATVAEQREQIAALRRELDRLMARIAEPSRLSAR